MKRKSQERRNRDDHHSGLPEELESRGEIDGIAEADSESGGGGGVAQKIGYLIGLAVILLLTRSLSSSSCSSHSSEGHHCRFCGSWQTKVRRSGWIETQFWQFC
jgi:hypothetical protein